MKMNTPQELIEDIRQGKMIVLMDDEDRENEGDLVMAASHTRPEDINFMATYGRGLICLTLSQQRCQQLDLPLMVQDNNAQHGTNFTLSIEATEGVSTGISAADRARTVQAAVARDAQSSDIVQPGHIFPLMAQPGGVLHRAGHTEAGCDLAKLAGLEPAATIVEIMNDDGTMARRPDLELFAEKHKLKIGTIADLIHYRILHENTIERVFEEQVPTVDGAFRLVGYRDTVDQKIHMALVKGEITPESAPLVRVHSFDPLRDMLGAIKDGRVGWSFDRARKAIADSDCGVVILLGYDVPADELMARVEYFFDKKRYSTPTSDDGQEVYRTIGTGSQILRDLGVHKMRLLSTPIKFHALSGFDLEITEYVNPQEGESNE